jgi:hypothetical protein
MVAIIGLVMIGVLISLLSWALAGEIDAERRRISSVDTITESPAADLTPTRQAA